MPATWTILSFHLNPSSNTLKQRTKKELRQKLTATALPLPSLLAQSSTTPHTRAHRRRVRRSCAWERIKKTHLPSLLAQTSTTPHTEAHRHRGRWSYAWSLETYRSRREPRSKGLFFMIFPFPQFGFRIIDGFFCFLGLWDFSVFWVYGFSTIVFGILDFGIGV